MKWSHWNFPTHKRVAVDFDNYAKAAELLVSPEVQCIINHATTEEDYRYLGEGWNCEHAIHPTSCTYCNPEYRNAEIKDCVTGCSGLTWHLDDTCIKCRNKEQHNAGFEQFLVDEGSCPDHPLGLCDCNW